MRVQDHKAGLVFLPVDRENSPIQQGHEPVGGAGLGGNLEADGFGPLDHRRKSGVPVTFVVGTAQREEGIGALPLPHRVGRVLGQAGEPARLKPGSAGLHGPQNETQNSENKHTEGEALRPATAARGFRRRWVGVGHVDR